MKNGKHHGVEQGFGHALTTLETISFSQVFDSRKAWE